MATSVYTGCCGWSYLRPKEFALERPYDSTLQAYAQMLSTVEVNSTFYRIPRRTTAEKWREEASA